VSSLGPFARALVTTLTPAGTAADNVPLTVIEDSRIAGKDWYVTCDSRQRGTPVTAHLTAAETPELLSRDEWTIDARGTKGATRLGAASPTGAGW